MLKVVCCIHFVQRLNVNAEIFNTFNCSHVNEQHEVVAVKCEQCIFNIPLKYYQEQFANWMCCCDNISRFEKCHTC